MKVPLLLLLALCLSACDSEVVSKTAAPSPSGSSTVVIVRELQGANDNQPFWTHISIVNTQKSGSTKPKEVLKLEGDGSVSANWNSDQEVEIHLDDSFHQNNEIPTRLYAHNIDFVFLPPSP